MNNREITFTKESMMFHARVLADSYVDVSRAIHEEAEPTLYRKICFFEPDPLNPSKPAEIDQTALTHCVLAMTTALMQLMQVGHQFPHLVAPSKYSLGNVDAWKAVGRIFPD